MSNRPTDPRIVRRADNEWIAEVTAMSHDDTLRDAAADNRHDTEHAYEHSDRYIADALNWVADHGHEDPLVVAVAHAAYRQSSQYAAVVDDALDGERRW